MARKGVRSNNSGNLLTEHGDRLSDLRSRVDQLASDLAELEDMGVNERRQASELRSRVLQTFKSIGRV